MANDTYSLLTVYSGWDGYQVSLVHAIAPLSRDQLIFRPAPHLRSAGEIARHICEGRVGWFYRTFGENSIQLASQVATWPTDAAIEEQPAELVKGLEATWQMIEKNLNNWTVANLFETFPLSYQGRNYALPRQWILWRIMAHDLHHGGELAVTLGLQGINIPELGDEGGHIIQPPLADPS